MKYLMSNLKSNKTLKEILEYKKILQKIEKKDIEFVLFPTSIFLSFFYDAPYKIGSQNISTYQTGSYTGEILASQLASLKVSYCLVNHAELREKEEDCIKKIKNATKNQIKVVFCLGEEERKTTEKTIEEIIGKANRIFRKLTKEEQENLLIAYEPNWIINKQEKLEVEKIKQITQKIKQVLKENYELNLPILYGGSINEKNIEDLKKINTIEGYLIGNCANNPHTLLEIIEKI